MVSGRETTALERAQPAAGADPSVVLRRRQSRQIALYALLGLILLTSWTEFGVRILWPAVRNSQWPNPGYWVGARLAWEGHAELAYADRPTFWRESARLGARQDLFEANMPTTLLIFLPIAPLDQATAMHVWVLASLVIFVAGWALLLWCLRIPLAGAIALSALVPLYPAFRENVVDGQAYLVLFAFAALGALSFSSPTVGAQSLLGGSRSRAGELMAGIGLGLAAILKSYYGAVLALPALLRGRWLTLIAALATFVAAALVTLLLWGPALWGKAIPLALVWHEKPESTVTAYQTLNGLLGHLFRYDAQWNPGPVVDLPWLVTPLWYALVALGVGLTLLVLWRVGRGGEPGTGAERLLQAALVVPLALALAPISEDYHYLLMLFPLSVVAVVLWERWSAWWRLDSTSRARPMALAVLTLLFLAGLALLAGPWRYNVSVVAGWRALLHYPRLYGALLVWAVMVSLLMVRRGQGEAPVAQA